MMQTEDVHTMANTQQMIRDLQETKEVLRHTTCDYITWATLRAKTTKELPPLSPWTSVDGAIVKKGALRVLADHGQGE
jgi:hypothetical protein